MLQLSKYGGAAMFAVVQLCWLRRMSFAQSKRMIANKVCNYKKGDLCNLILKMEKAVQRDEGRRGIAEIFLPPGELLNAAEEMLKSKSVAILTGFPCLLDYNPPTETDGPLGALALAKTLLKLNKEVVIATDQCNEEVLLACTAASDLDSFGKMLSLESFPPEAEFSNSDHNRLELLCNKVDLVIAIERTGPSFEGHYRTMRCRDMSHLVAPLEILLAGNSSEMISFNNASSPMMKWSQNISMDPPEFSSQPGSAEGSIDRLSPIQDLHTPEKPYPPTSFLLETPTPSRMKPMRSIGIGDGGNEVGMGKVYHKILQSSIPSAKEIACVVPTDHLVIASVSNWGGYALCAATAVLSTFASKNLSTLNSPMGAKESATATVSSEEVEAAIRELLPTDDEELRKCRRIVDAGARDGMTQNQDMYVDGMPMQKSLDILQELRDVCKER